MFDVDFNDLEIGEERRKPIQYTVVVPPAEADDRLKLKQERCNHLPVYCVVSRKACIRTL
jgi:hypothetical protein